MLKVNPSYHSEHPKLRFSPTAPNSNGLSRHVSLSVLIRTPTRVTVDRADHLHNNSSGYGNLITDSTDRLVKINPHTTMCPVRCFHYHILHVHNTVLSPNASTLANLHINRLIYEPASLLKLVIPTLRPEASKQSFLLPKSPDPSI